MKNNVNIYWLEMPKDYSEDRKKVSELISRVLANSLCVREAILKFPKDVDDSTIRTAYHALVHFEADEDMRKSDLAYKEEQDDYLEFVAKVLQKGEALPKNVVKNYEKYYKNIQTPRSNSMKGLMKSLCKFLNV